MIKAGESVVGTRMVDLFPAGLGSELSRKLYESHVVTIEDVRLAAERGQVTAQALFEIMRERLGFAVEGGDLLADQP